MRRLVAGGSWAVLMKGPSGELVGLVVVEVRTDGRDCSVWFRDHGGELGVVLRVLEILRTLADQLAGVAGGSAQ